ncbi:MAG TPA: hypothetical protein VMA77_02010 [Solirubrobacteraceae bacterium]|nr:hypothetical protein [Solirubrobacteraceae bacterium]
MRRRALILLSVVATATVSLLAAGCGSSRSSTSSVSAGSGGPPTQAQIQQENADLVRFADCMRSHGVSNFPDPTNPRAFKQAMNPNDQASPAFGSAVTTCQHLLPNGGQRTQGQSAPPSQAQIAAELAFARCIRSHGFPRFPDPNSSGDLSHEMLAAAGINLQQPAVVQAADACVGVAHGFITRADVARFVAGH